MFDNSQFQQLVTAGQPTGEVVSSERFLVRARGLEGIAMNAQVVFETGEIGLVREIGHDTAVILNLQSENTPLGKLVVLKDNIFSVPVGETLIGRIMTPLGLPLDGKGKIQVGDDWPLLRTAPGIMERSLLSDRLPTGVMIVDSLFPVVLGQRIAILGDTKTGKTSFLVQLGLNQRGSDRIVVYVLIGKRRVEIDQLIQTLDENGALPNSIVIVADIFDSLAQSYIAPFIGCAVAEQLWHAGRDVVIIYDDLASHAKVYREVALLAGDNPGRDSYPGDMFFAHSSLLERAGKLAVNGKTLTALPVVITPADDITAFLPTSIMSITDGQIIFDLESFRRNIRPAVNAGLSVSRVGGRCQTTRQKKLSGALFKRLADYRQAQEFANFGSEIGDDARRSLLLGDMITEAFRQPPRLLHTMAEQEMVLGTILASAGARKLDVGLLKLKAAELADSIKKEEDIDPLIEQLLNLTTLEGQV